MSNFSVRYMTDLDRDAWDAFVSNHPQGNIYQRSFWGAAIQKSYGHNAYNLMAFDSAQNVVGVLPLVHIKHFIFGNNLYSMPYADLGGLLAEPKEASQLLLEEAFSIAEDIGVSSVELRQAESLETSVVTDCGSFNRTQGQLDKVRLLIQLPESAELLMASFKAKLRSQIRRPLKDGLYVKSGGLELLDDFYSVFAVNMRDLGSPVHAKSFIRNIVELSSGLARLFVVYKDEAPLACSMTLSGDSVMYNPWASSLRQYSSMSPNMLLYWAMLEHGCKEQFKSFDFGRSTPGEGTYRFKKQWGVIERPLKFSIYSRGKPYGPESKNQKSKFEMAIQLWRRLPVAVTKIAGPVVRKNIGL